MNTQSQTAHLAERISRLTAQEASPAAHLARRIRALQRYTPSLSYKTQPTPSPSLTSDCPRTAFDHVRRGLDGATPSRAALYKYPSLFDVPATPKPTARRDLGRLFDDLDDTAPLDAMVLPAESLDDTADLDAVLVTTPRSRHRRSRSATPVATPQPSAAPAPPAVQAVVAARPPVRPRRLYGALTLRVKGAAGVETVHVRGRTVPPLVTVAQAETLLTVGLSTASHAPALAPP